MAKTDRRNPKRAKSSTSDYSLMEYMQRFPDDDACLDYLWRTRFSEDGEHADCPKCKRHTTFKRYETKQRRGGSWTCTGCGHHVSVTAGTIFEGSSTSLHLWFYAMFLMASTRCGISAKQLERELGVTYKTAWRMFNKIRNELMADDDEPLTGNVEIDETGVHGRPRGPKMTKQEAAVWRERQVSVLGMVERGGRLKLRVIESRRGEPLSGAVRANVNPSSIIFTDDWMAYKPLGREYLGHSVINHSAGVYVRGDIHTNSIEGAFGNLKTGMRGAYKKVSRKWLQSYLDEYSWRYNARLERGAMFEQLLRRATRPSASIG
jgi:transposase-like protein